MKNLKASLRQLLTNRRFLATIFILIGLGVIVIYGLRSYRAYQQLQYIREQGLDRGIASIEAIAPWMTVRYVSVAYAVPEEYIFAQMGIPYNQRNSRETIGHLTRSYFDRQDRGERRDPVLVQQIGEIILAYRENPVITGLSDVRPWMTMQYIANSTGVPTAYIFAQLGWEAREDDNFKPLDQLAKEKQFDGDPRDLDQAIEAILEAYEDTP